MRLRRYSVITTVTLPGFNYFLENRVLLIADLAIVRCYARKTSMVSKFLILGVMLSQLHAGGEPGAHTLDLHDAVATTDWLTDTFNFTFKSIV